MGSKCSWADEDRYTRNRSVQQVRAELLGASSIQHPCSVVGVYALLSELLGAVRSIQRPASSIPAVLSELTHCCRNCSKPSNDINQIYVMCLVLSVLKRCSHLGDTLLGSKCSWTDEDMYNRNRSVQQARATLQAVC